MTGFYRVRLDALVVDPTLAGWVAFGLRHAAEVVERSGGVVPAQVRALAVEASAVASSLDRPRPVPSPVPSGDDAGSDAAWWPGLDVTQVAERLEVSREYVRRLVACGRLRGVGGGRGGQWRIDPASVDAYEEAR